MHFGLVWTCINTWGADGHVRTFPHVPRIRNTRNCPVRSKELSSPWEHPSTVVL